MDSNRAQYNSMEPIGSNCRPDSRQIQSVATTDREAARNSHSRRQQRLPGLQLIPLRHKRRPHRCRDRCAQALNESAAGTSLGDGDPVAMTIRRRKRHRISMKRPGSMAAAALASSNLAASGK